MLLIQSVQRPICPTVCWSCYLRKGMSSGCPIYFTSVKPTQYGLREFRSTKRIIPLFLKESIFLAGFSLDWLLYIFMHWSWCWTSELKKKNLYIKTHLLTLCVYIFVYILYCYCSFLICFDIFSRWYLIVTIAISYCLIAYFCSLVLLIHFELEFQGKVIFPWGWMKYCDCNSDS